MPFVEIHKRRVHYAFAEHPGLPILTLSNSLGADLRMWEPQVEALTSHFQILRYDTRGHGQSSIGSEPTKIEDLAGDVLGLLDFLNIESTSFCGISMGGSLGLWLALHNPDRLNKLILANTAARIGTTETWNARISLVRESGLDSIADSTMERWFTPKFRQQNPGLVSRTRATLAATDAAGYAACCAAIRDADFRADLSSIDVPTLIIAGEFDPVTTPEDARFLSSRIPGSQSVQLAAAHLSCLGAPTQFNAALLRFLAE